MFLTKSRHLPINYPVILGGKSSFRRRLPHRQSKNQIAMAVSFCQQNLSIATAEILFKNKGTQCIEWFSAGKR